MNSPFIKKLEIVLLIIGFTACQSTKPTQLSQVTVDSSSGAINGDTVRLSEVIRLGKPAAATKTDTTQAPDWAAKKFHYNPSRTQKNDLVHTRLDVRFDWTKQQLNGTATITCKPHFYPQRTLELDAKGFDLHSVQLVNEKTRQSTPLQHTYDGRLLTIALDRVYNHDEKFTVRVEYTAKPNELPKGGSEAITSDKGLYFINPDGSEPNKPRQIWTQGETQANSAWFPTIDAPNQKTTQEMYITVDSNFVTLSNGVLEYSKDNPDGSRTDYWKMDKPHAPYLFMMAVGEFAVVKDKYQNKEVSYYVEPAYEKYARDIFGRTPEMMDFFAKKLGVAYPWDKYAQVVVRDYVSGAMENTTATIHMEDLQVDNRSLLDENWDYIIAHELFHQWFGDLVTIESWSNLPLNESFANYAEYLWNEHKYGIDEADYKGQDEMNQYLAEAERKQEPLIRYYYNDREDMFDSHSYAKGGRILHMLRKYVGDEAFFTVLRNYLEEHKFSTVEIHDLRIAFEKVTGEDLNWFFNQWFLAAGHADLKVEQHYTDGKVALTVTQQQDSTYTPIYRLPLAVDIWVGGQKKRYDVVVDKAVQTLEFPASAQPDLVIFDAEQQLVGTIQHNKSTAELVFQYQHADKYLAKYEALTKLAKSLTDPGVRQTMLEAMNDPFWKIRQIAVSNFNQYEGEQSAQLIEKLKTLTLQDPRSYVRAEALGTLASLPGGDDFSELYRHALDDQSYTVAATALFAYLSLEPADASVQAAKFESYTDDNIVLALAGYYTDQGDVSKFPWMVTKVQNSKGILLYQLIQSFGLYLMKVSPELQKQGAQELAKIASENNIYGVRYAAFQSLSLIKEVEGVNELRKQIKEHETDPRLINAYESMM